MILVFLVTSILLGGPAQADLPPLRVLTDRPPETLNPRNALDSQGQRIGALLFRALTRVDQNLIPQPELAAKFHSENENRRWIFEIKDAIPAKNLIRCFENYRVGNDKARIMGGFSGWVGTRLIVGQIPKIIFELKEPDPYFSRNVSLLRYFETKSNVESPCSEPKSIEDIKFSGQFDVTKSNEKELVLRSKTIEHSDLHFYFIPDETARTLALIRGQGDLAQNTLGLTKTRWAQKKHPTTIQVLERGGTSVSYLAFNLKDPILKNLDVRRAITLSLPIDKYVDGKMMGLGKRTFQILSNDLAESQEIQGPPYDPKLAENLLDKAGFRRQSNGFRFKLSYRTTPIREGIELAKWIQFELKRVGIELEIRTVEPAVFLNSIRKGQFQLFSSRWIGVSDASILYRSLHSKQNLNRWAYQSKATDQALESMMAEVDPSKRAVKIQNIQKTVLLDLPFFPLFYWKTSLLMGKNWSGLKSENLSLSGAYDPLLLLHYDSN